MIASGKTVSDMIAKELSLSVKTISEYRARLLVKMKLKNSAELTHYAIKNQLIELTLDRARTRLLKCPGSKAKMKGTFRPYIRCYGKNQTRT